MKLLGCGKCRGLADANAQRTARSGLLPQEKCKACHPGEGKQGIGPDLSKMIPAHRDATWLIPHFKNPAQVVPAVPCRRSSFLTPG